MRKAKGPFEVYIVLDFPFTPIAIAVRCLIFTHISQHARLEIPMDLRDLRAFSPPRPEYGARGARSKDVGKDRRDAHATFAVSLQRFYCTLNSNQRACVARLVKVQSSFVFQDYSLPNGIRTPLL